MRTATICVVALALPVLAVLASEDHSQALPSLEVVSRLVLAAPSDGWGTTDLRWAGKDSIYVAELNGGVTERRLIEGLPVVRQLVPQPRKIGMFEIRRFAVTDKWIVASNLAQVAWKERSSTAAEAGWRVAKKRGFFHDFDIHGDEITMLGWPPGDGYKGLERGGVVWRADLSEGLNEWEVVHESNEIASDLERIRTESALGSIRYLRRGGWILAPSFVPGALQLSGSGTVKSRWGAQDLLGVEASEAEHLEDPAKAWVKGRRDPALFIRFANTKATIDSVLSLPEGPALVVREPRNGRPRYRLAVLGPEIQWYEIPMPDGYVVAQLRGDADAQRRIVLVPTLRIPLRAAQMAEREVVVFAVPG